MKRILGVLVAASLILGVGMPVPAQASSVKLRQAILDLRNKLNTAKPATLPSATPVAASAPKPAAVSNPTKLQQAILNLRNRLNTANPVVTPVVKPNPVPVVIPVVKPNIQAVGLRAALIDLGNKIKVVQAKIAANKVARDAQTEQKLKNVLPQDRGSIGGPLGY